MIDTLTDVKFEFYIGNTYSRDFTLSGWSLSVEKMYFTVKENENNKRAVFQKTLNDGITLVSDEDGIKTFNILIDNVDTDGMKTEVEYPFDVDIHSIGADGKTIEKTIMTGTVYLLPHSTRTYNE